VGKEGTPGEGTRAYRSFSPDLWLLFAFIGVHSRLKIPWVKYFLAPLLLLL
jgi:hypothetical protein